MRHSKAIIWSREHILFLLFFIGVAIFHMTAYDSGSAVISSDGEYYYKYLPNYIMYGDFTSYNKYPLGVAMLQLPFFLVVLLIESLKSVVDINPYSQMFQVGMYVSGLVYLIIGNYLLYHLLVIIFKNKYAAFATNVIVTIGGMLLWYSGNSFSHIYSFFACTLFCYLTCYYEERYRCKKVRRVESFWFGASLGLVFDLRNVNVIIVFFYIFYNVTNWKNFVIRLKSILRWERFSWNILGGGLAILPQLINCKLQTGHLLINSYEGEAFSFALNPKIYEVLFSDAKGFLIFSPVMLLAFTGLLIAGKTLKPYMIAVTAVLFAEIYICAAWCWWFGSAYGLRPFVDIMCVLAIPICGFLCEIYWTDISTYTSWFERVTRIIVGMWIVLSLLCSIAWMIGCKYGIIHVNLAQWSQFGECLKWIVGHILQSISAS